MLDKDLPVSVTDLYAARDYIIAKENEKGADLTDDELMLAVINSQQSSKGAKPKPAVKTRGYLNKYEVEQVCKISASLEAISQVNEERKKHGYDPVLAKYLKTAETYLFKSMEVITQNLSKEELLKLYKRTKNWEIYMGEYSVRFSKGGSK